MGKILSLLLVLLLAFLSWWFQDDWQQPLLQNIKTQNHFPDYFMADFNITKMDIQGKVSHTMVARYMQHFNDNGEIQIEKPVIKLQSNGNSWVIRAERAETKDGSFLINLFDKVHIERKNNQQEVDLSIDTEYLEFNTQSRIAQTHISSRITSAQNIFTANNMLIDYNKGTLELNTKVKGLYVPRHFNTH